jgi:hypothetical protein
MQGVMLLDGCLSHLLRLGGLLRPKLRLLLQLLLVGLLQLLLLLLGLLLLLSLLGLLLLLQ